MTKAALGNRQTVEIPGPAPAGVAVNPTAEDFMGLTQLTEALQTASEYGALLRAELAVGRSIYVVPFDLVSAGALMIAP